MERSGYFTPAGKRSASGNLVEQGGTLHFKDTGGEVYDEEALKRGDLRLNRPSDGSSPPDLLALRDMCVRRGIKVDIGRPKFTLTSN